MSKSVVRDSKFRHVFGKALNKEGWYEGIQSAGISAPDSNIVACNSKFFACAWKGGGGPFVVHPFACAGKLERVVNKEVTSTCVFNGHTMPVQDLDFSPFHESVLATASEDSSVRLWNFEGKITSTTPLSEDQGEGTSVVLRGHDKKATLVRWNPVASHVLTSSAFDNTVRIWDASSGGETAVINLDDTAQHMAWAYDGSFLAVACKDKKINLIDPRAQGASAKFDAHLGAKGMRVCFLGRTNMLASTGFSRESDRQLFLYDVRQMSNAARRSETKIDQSSGSLMPFFDPDTNLLYVAGKGDCNIRYYEITESEPLIHYVDQFTGKEPQRGLALCPKGVVDTSCCEVARFLRLCDNKLEPVSFTVPRKSDTGNDDLYPPTFAGKPALTAGEWSAGQNAAPLLTPLAEAGKLNTFVLPKSGSASDINSLDTKQPASATTAPTPPPAAAPPPESPAPLKAPQAPHADNTASAQVAAASAAPATTARVTVVLQGVGELGVGVEGSMELRVRLPPSDERIAALQARIKELETENADLKKVNRELSQRLTD